jgi:hypothetical protein
MRAFLICKDSLKIGTNWLTNEEAHTLQDRWLIIFVPRPAFLSLNDFTERDALKPQRFYTSPIQVLEVLKVIRA